MLPLLITLFPVLDMEMPLLPSTFNAPLASTVRDCVPVRLQVVVRVSPPAMVVSMVGLQAYACEVPKPNPIARSSGPILRTVGTPVFDVRLLLLPCDLVSSLTATHT